MTESTRLVAVEERKLNALLGELDEQHFRGELRAAGWRCAIAALRPGHYGSARYDYRRISIAEHLLADVPELRRTLLHEMIHAALHIAGDPSHQGRNESHGAAFAAELARLAAAGEDVSGEEDYVTCGDTSASRLQIAAVAYLARQRRSEHPAGKFDAGGRWYPVKAEWRTCCDGLREPSCSFPYSLLKHCCTIAHLSRLYGVDTVALRNAVAQAKRSCVTDVPPKAVEAAMLSR